MTTKFVRWMLASAILSGIFVGAAKAQDEYVSTIDKAIAFLKAKAPAESEGGKIALALMAMVKAGEPHDDAVIKAMTAKLLSHVSGDAYKPSTSGGPDNYEAPIALMALAALDQKKYLNEIEVIAKYIMSKQLESGAWNYADNRDDGDCSMTQYAILGLWEAANAGVEIPIPVWDKALFWYCTHQGNDGGFDYHPINKEMKGRAKEGHSNHTMTVAGAACMYICQSRLPLPKKFRRTEKLTDLLIPVEMDDKGGPYKIKCDAETVTKGVEDAARWMASHMKVEKPTAHNNLQCQYYYLYGLERYGTLAKSKTIGSTDWYRAGGDFCSKIQKSDGSFDDGFFGPIVDTSFALLFLGKSTEKIIKNIKIAFGRGTMLGGRGLPTASSMPDGISARKKLKYAMALESSVDDILKVFDDPSMLEVDEGKAESIAITLEGMSGEDLLKKFNGDLKKIRQFAYNEKPEVRRVGIAALVRTKDYRIVPILIKALSDPDAEVYRSARDGLRFISRKFDDMGLPEKNPTPEQIKAGTAKWTEWFNGLKIRVDPEQQFDDPK